MIYREPGIALERTSPIFPECIYGFIRMQLSYRVTPALFLQSRVNGANFWGKQGIVTPAVRRVDVKISRHDVEITRDNHWHIETNKCRKMRLEPFEPVQFVFEFRPRAGIAV